MLSAAAACLGSHLRCHTCGASHVPAGEAPSCPMQQPADQLKTIDTVVTQDFVAKELFKVTKPVCQSILNTPPLPPLRAPSVHDTWTYDSSRLSLSFNVCQGQSSRRTHMARGGGRPITSAKVTWKVIVAVRGDKTPYMLINRTRSTCVSGVLNSSDGMFGGRAAYSGPHRVTSTTGDSQEEIDEGRQMDANDEKICRSFSKD